MLKALVDKKLVDATHQKSGTLGECPHCGKSVRARCGEINVEHWAHLDDECPYITEKDTEWHKAWKNKFEKKGYLIEERFDKFITDAYNPKTNTVVEFQHSSITPQEIVDRCNYYKNINKNIKWIFDYTEKYKRRHIDISEEVNNDKYYYRFKVKWQKKSYIQGISNKTIASKIPIYFNIIYNYDTKKYTQLRVIKGFDEYESDKYSSNRYRNYLDILNDSIGFNTVIAEINYDINSAVLLKPNTMRDDGKYGSGYLEFIY